MALQQPAGNDRGRGATGAGPEAGARGRPAGGPGQGLRGPKQTGDRPSVQGEGQGHRVQVLGDREAARGSGGGDRVAVGLSDAHRERQKVADRRLARRNRRVPQAQASDETGRKRDFTL